jgi:hypothetical protein
MDSNPMTSDPTDSSGRFFYNFDTPGCGRFFYNFDTPVEVEKNVPHRWKIPDWF